ncbi:SDR family oxidoreductase [bacterium]|nr:SDR family oxidoreductase [bacterium]
MKAIYSNSPFKDKVVLVTGGRSGIGYDIASLFLAEGAKVIIVSRKEELLKEAEEKLKAFGHVSSVACDIRETEQIDILIERIKSDFGRLDVLVNNAGGQFLSPAEDISEKGWNAVINNNLTGTWYMMQKMANAFFIPQKSGSICNIILSIYKGFPGMAHSAAARAGVDNLTKTLAIEWSKYNIQINAIAPGYIQSTGLKNYPQQFVDQLISKVPVKRLGTTEEVAWLVSFLTGPYAQFITGETVYVDGGQRLWGDIYEL